MVCRTGKLGGNLKLNNETYELGKLVTQMLEKKKTVKVDVLDVHELTPLADLFVIVVGSNVRQTQSLADDIEELVKEQGIEVHKEGYHTATWILLDCGEMIVHVLEQQHATFYGLERLWKDAPMIAYTE